MKVIIHGIANCDSVRKARRWLQEHQIEHHFHDFREEGLSNTELQRWAGSVGWETLLNRRGNSWHQLPAQRREALDSARALALMLENPTLIKRPVLTCGETASQPNLIEVGFDPARYTKLFS